MFEQHDAIVRLLRDNDPGHGHPDQAPARRRRAGDHHPPARPRGGGRRDRQRSRPRHSGRDRKPSGARRIYPPLPPLRRRRRHRRAPAGCSRASSCRASRPSNTSASSKSWGRQLKSVSPTAAISTRERVAILTNYLANDLGFRGNSEQYYDVRNSLLPSLIDTKTRYSHLVGGAVYLGRGAGGHQGRGDQFAGTFHRAARGYFSLIRSTGEKS